MTQLKQKERCPQCGSKHTIVVGPTNLRPIRYCNHCKHILERLDRCLIPIEDLANYPNGTVVMYKKRIYWLSRGLEGRIVTDSQGHWKLVRDLKWRTFYVVFVPPSGTK